MSVLRAGERAHASLRPTPAGSAGDELPAGEAVAHLVDQMLELRAAHAIARHHRLDNRVVQQFLDARLAVQTTTPPVSRWPRMPAHDVALVLHLARRCNCETW